MNSNNLVHTDSGLKRYFIDIYQNVSLGIGLMGSVAFLIHTLKAYPSGSMGIIFMFLPIIISIVFSSSINRISSETAQLLYLAYSGSLGVSCSYIFAIYTGESIFGAFISTASIFFMLSFYARTTDKDLTNMRSLLGISLWGIILVSMINLIIGSSLISLFVSAITVLVFSGLIIYDHQNLINLYHQNIDHESREKVAIMGALNLLISFVNIFIALLRIFGERRRD